MRIVDLSLIKYIPITFVYRGIGQVRPKKIIMRTSTIGWQWISTNTQLIQIIIEVTNELLY